MEMNLGSVTILVDSPEKLSFKLTGKVGSWQDEQDGPDWFAGKYMEEKFEAATISEAIQKARSLVAEFLEKNEELCPPHLYKERACTFDFSLSQVVWEYEFTKKKPGRRATEGVPEVPEHITERYKRF